MPKFIDLTGVVFGNLTVVRRGKTQNNHIYWVCKCVCGSEKEVESSTLKRPNVSCGCFKKALNTSHGHSRVNANRRGSPTYQSWMSMKQRCLYPKHPKFKRYGGRGVKICEKWLDSFSSFLEDMGLRPEGKTLDRIDPDGDYAPENCRWADISTQNKNRNF